MNVLELFKLSYSSEPMSICINRYIRTYTFTEFKKEYDINTIRIAVDPESKILIVKYADSIGFCLSECIPAHPRLSLVEDKNFRRFIILHEYEETGNLIIKLKNHFSVLDIDADHSTNLSRDYEHCRTDKFINGSCLYL